MKLRLMMTDFELISEKIPKAKRLKKVSKYDELIDKFIVSGLKTARVQPKENIRSSTIAAGIKNRIDMKGLKHKIDVVVRSGKVYLKKLSKN